MRNIDVCLTPELLHLFELEGKIVVVVDVLRATSCMTTAIAHGVKKIIPVATLEECAEYKKLGFITAAERDGKTAEGFDLGNSPFSYMDECFDGKTIVVTTTNGTLAITKSAKAEKIIIGSFLNKSAIINYLLSQPNDVVVLCAGWKGKINLEDSLFAGAVVEGLSADFGCNHDSAIAALTLYNVAKKNMKKFLATSSHARRLSNLNIKKDIDFCLKSDVYDVIPVMKGKALELMSPVENAVREFAK
jgi:2-phosphosulfolactate phosphatase